MGPLNFVKKLLPLEEMSLIRVVVNLCNESDILASFQELSMQSQTDDNLKKAYIATVAEKVKAKVSTLDLPELVTKRMLDLARPIVLDISNWKLFHESILANPLGDFDVQIFKHLFWTSKGIVDYEETAQNLVCLEALHCVIRYRLACLYCLEDCIPLLSRQLPKKYKISLFKKSIFTNPLTQLEIYWSYALLGEVAKLDNLVSVRYGKRISFYRYALNRWVSIGNKAAIKYFYQKQSNETVTFRKSIVHTLIEERRKNKCQIHPMNKFPNEKFSDALCYLLSIMHPTEETQILNQRICDVLTFFLDWPWEDIFLDIVDHFWKAKKNIYKAITFPEDLYDNLLDSIKNSDYCFPNSFQDFFLLSPKDFKKHFVEYECQSGHFFSQFFSSEDTETIKVIFRNLDKDDMMRLVSSRRFFDHFECLTRKDCWHLVELCLREIITWMFDTEKLKEIYSGFLTPEESEESRWKRFMVFSMKSTRNLSIAVMMMIQKQ